MLYTPYLDLNVMVEYLCAGKPSLGLGNSLFESIASPVTVHPLHNINDDQAQLTSTVYFKEQASNA